MTSAILLSLSSFIFIFASASFCKQSFKIFSNISSHPDWSEAHAYVLLTLDNRGHNYLKCIYIEIFEKFLLADMKDRQNPNRKRLSFVDICFRSRDMSFESLGNLEKKCEKKIEHFVPL